MKITVVYPQIAHSAYAIATNNFIDLVNKVSGDEITATTDNEYILNDSDLTVLIGSDAVNSATASLYLDQKIDIYFASCPYMLITPHIVETLNKEFKIKLI